MHRSYLYVPGDRPDRLSKALDAGADALIADLEDGVAPAAKHDARSAVAEFLATRAPQRNDRTLPGEVEVMVRVNPGDLLAADLGAIVRTGVGTIYLPKSEPASLADADALLTEAEHAAGRHSGSVSIVALVETARGLQGIAGVAGHRRVRNLAIGEADLTAELGITPDTAGSADGIGSPLPEGGAGHALWPLRMHVVVASAAAGIDPPTAPVNTDFRDLEGLRRSTIRLAQAGFAGRAAIHPAQVPVINAVFTPSEDDIASASRLVELFEESVARGDGVCVDDRGRMVDEAVIRSARRVLARRPPR